MGTITDDDDRGLALSLPSVAVNEDATATYTVALATQPMGDVAVRIRGAHADVAVQAAGEATSVKTLWLSFTPADWNTAQTVTVHTLADADMDNEAASLKHTATGGDYDAVTATLSVAVTDTTAATNPAPGTNVPAAFAASALPDQTYKERQQVRVQLPAATTGNPPLTYTLTPALPPGLRYDAATRRIGGAATAVPTPASCTYTHTVTDADGDTATLPFPLTVEADLTPSFGDATVAAHGYPVGTAIVPLVLPAATGGNAPLSYALTPALPPGLTYTVPADPIVSGGTLAGTPTEVRAATTYTLTATDTDGDTATLAFTLTITATGRLVPGEGTTAYPIGGQQLTITRHPDTPAVEIDLPVTLARDVTVTLSPPAADVPLARGQFGFGTRTAARAVVDISVCQCRPAE